MRTERKLPDDSHSWIAGSADKNTPPSKKMLAKSRKNNKDNTVKDIAEKISSPKLSKSKTPVQASKINSKSSIPESKSIPKETIENKSAETAQESKPEDLEIEEEGSISERVAEKLDKKVQDVTLLAKEVGEKASKMFSNHRGITRIPETLKNLPFLSKSARPSQLESLWRDLYNKCDQNIHNKLKIIDEFTQKISTERTLDPSGAIIAQVKQGIPENDFNQLSRTKGGPDNEHLSEMQKKAIHAYTLSVGEMLIEKLPSLPLAPYGKQKTIRTDYKPRLPHNMRYNSRLETGGKKTALESAKDSQNLSFHYAFASGYRAEEHQREYEDNPEHANLQTADYCMQRSLSIGNLPALINCHVDGSGQGNSPVQFARLFSESFAEGVTDYLETHSISDSQTQARAVMAGLAYAQQKTMGQNISHAGGTLLASLSMQDPKGQWQQVAAAVGDVDLVRLNEQGIVYMPTMGARNEPLDVRYPGGQMGVNRKCGYLPDFSNLRLILSPQLQPKEQLISFSDGVIDNLYPYAFHTRPSEAVAEMKAQGFYPHLANMKEFIKLQDCTPEQRQELLNLYKSYLCFKLAAINAASPQPGSLSAFIDAVIKTAQEQALTEKENHEPLGRAVNTLGHIVKSDDLSGSGIQFT
jgi:hypothetical protein